jgi:hypothetical protein
VHGMIRLRAPVRSRMEKVKIVEKQLIFNRGQETSRTMNGEK